MITGLKGIGDFQCLEVLERDNPKFDRAAQDRANRAAATQLGIAGTPVDWTWENWMEIEIERGLQPHCYACLIVDSTTFGQPYGASVPANDPRLIVGLRSGTALESYILNQLGDRSGAASQDGIYWRTAAAFRWLGIDQNAPQTLESLTFLIGEWSGHDVDGDGQWSTLNMGKAFKEFAIRGGYTTLTGKETYQDQVFQAASVLYMLQGAGVNPMLQTALSNAFEQAITQCQLDYLQYKTFGHCVADKLAPLYT